MVADTVMNRQSSYSYASGWWGNNPQNKILLFHEFWTVKTLLPTYLTRLHTLNSCFVHRPTRSQGPHQAEELVGFEPATLKSDPCPDERGTSSSAWWGG